MSISSWLSFRTPRFAAATLTLVLVVGHASNTAHAGVTANVSEILIGTLDQRTAGVTDSWSFDVEILGTEIVTITLLTPDGELLLTEDFEQDGDEWCLEVDFPSLTALQTRFSTGDYTFTINGTPIILEYDPNIPDGAISASFPPHFSNMPNGQPTFASTTTCTNCNLVEAIVENEFATIEIETPSAISPAPLPSSYQFSDFGPNIAGPPISFLPPGGYGFCVLNSAVTPLQRTLGASDDFLYIQERGNDDVVFFTVTTPTIMSDVGEVNIEYFETGGDWFFATATDGSGVANATIIPPNQAPIAYVFADGEFDFEDGPFVDEAAARAQYPPTAGVDKYVVVIDGGEKFYSADFAPGSPDGGITTISPTDGATVGSQPTFTLSNLCTNCDSQAVNIESLANDGVDAINFATMSPFPAVIAFADFAENQGSLGPIMELPAGEYDVEIDTAIEDFSQPSFTPADQFLFFSGTFRDASITITVPEPGALLAQLIAGLTLVGLRRARLPGGIHR